MHNPDVVWFRFGIKLISTVEQINHTNSGAKKYWASLTGLPHFKLKVLLLLSFQIDYILLISLVF